MKKQALSIAVMIAGAYPAASSALSLGDIESNSNLNQPLRAKIELLAAGAQDAQQLQVRLAPASVFNRVGIDRPAFLDSLRFSTSVQNGKPVILVSSEKPITEPFVNFLLEVSWPQGQLLKEYTVMLDPPVLMQPGNTVAGNEAAVRAEPRANGTVNRPAPVQPNPEVLADAQEAVPAAPQTARQVRVQQQPRRAAPNRQAGQQRAANPAQGGGSRTYRVRQGDTLFKVASQLSQPGTNIDQMMMALYRANPQAFIDGNINGLKSGVTLKAPGARGAQSVSRAEARRQVRQHYVDWKKVRTNDVAKAGGAAEPNRERPAANTGTGPADNARLEVLGSKDKAGANDKVVAGAGKERLAELEKELALARESLSSQQRENTDLKSRVDELESMLRKKNRLITLRDEQLAEMQKSMNGGKPATGGQTQIPPLGEDNAEPQPKPAEPKPAEPMPVQPEVNNNSSLINQQTPPVNPDSKPTQPDGSDIQNYLGNATNNNEVMRSAPNQQQAGMPNSTNQNTPASGAMTPAERAAAAAAALNGGLNNPNPQTNNLGGNGLVADPTQTSPAQQAASTNPNPVKPEPQAITPQPAEPPKPVTPPTTVKPKPTEPPKPAQVPAEAQGGNDLMSMLTSPLAWKIGAGALLSLLLLALLARFLGKRKSTKPREPEFNEAQFGLDDDIPPVHKTSATGNVDFSDLGKQLDKAEQKRPSFDDMDDDPFGVKLGNSHQTNKSSALVTQVDAKVEQPEDEDEVLMEANVYIAYGLHQQAESELKKALEKHPSRLEYRHKLLENYFAANNREAFDEQAQIFANSRNADRQGKLWKDVMTWGAKISPDNSLYSNGASSSNLGKLAGSAAIGAAVAGAAGLATHDVQADAPSPDFDLDASSPENNISLKDDLAAALNALEHDELSTDKQDDDFDFNLDDFDQDLNENSSLTADGKDQGFAKAGRQDFHEAETALLADDDLDFNLDELMGNQVTENKSVPKAESKEVADEADLGSFDFDEPLDLNQEEPLVTAKAQAAPDSDDLDNMLDMDFDELTKTVDAPKVAAPADELDENNVLDFDLDQLAMEDKPVSASGKAAAANELAAKPAADNVTSLNLHLDKDTGIKKILPQDTFYTAPEAQTPANPDDDWLGDIDEALSFLDMPEEELDLHEAHISTKLDLARAYLDMGDIEGARSTLEEVMVEGNDNQRREAETLLHQTG